MAFKRYIKRNGKIYGPYIYHNRKIDGKVVSEYRGKGEDGENKKTLYKGSVINILGKVKTIDKRYLFFGITFFILFAGLYFYNLGVGESIIFYNHKYPPDFYYLFFGLSFTCFSLIIGRLKLWHMVRRRFPKLIMIRSSE